MKKIVLFAIATMAVSSASAVAPMEKLGFDKSELQRVNAACEIGSPLRLRAGASKAVSIKDMAKQGISRADEGVVEGATDVTALYGPSQGSFYCGWTPNGSGYKAQFGFTGIRNRIVFPNASTGAEASEWSYGYAVGVDNGEYVYDMQYSDEDNLAMLLKPETIIKTPELTVSANGKTDSYTSPVLQYFAGLSPELWLSQEPAEDVHDTLGASLYAFQSSSPVVMDDFTIDRNPSSQDKDYFKNGTSVQWYDYFSDSYTGTDFKNITVKGFGSMVSSKPSPYMLKNMWAYFLLTCSEDVVLTSYVYTISPEVGVDYASPIGKAELSYRAGSYPDNSGDLMGIFSYVALDEDGYESDMPLIIDALTPIFVTIEGLDNPAITRFKMALASESVLPIDGDLSLQATLYPYHALAILDLEFADKGSDDVYSMTTEDVSPWLYFADQTQTSVFFGTDFWMFFDVEFPTIYNLDEFSKDYATAEFSAEVPVDGGSVDFSLFASFDISGLVEGGLMTVEASDWLTYTASTDLTTGVTSVTVTGEALPEGVDGRRGVVSFKGYACDFDLNVTQGEVAGISNVAATTGKVELFDLQGRKLNAVPANGLYLERNGNVTVKRVARN